MPRAHQPSGHELWRHVCMHALPETHEGQCPPDDVDPDACWSWTYGVSKMSDGRPAISFGPRGHQRKLPVIRLLYEEAFGEVGNDVQARSKCRNRQCVNPTHVERYGSLPQYASESAMAQELGVMEIGEAGFHTERLPGPGDSTHHIVGRLNTSLELAETALDREATAFLRAHGYGPDGLAD